jgi:hypothetical protein
MRGAIGREDRRDSHSGSELRADLAIRSGVNAGKNLGA